MTENLVSINFYPQSILKEDKSPDFGIEIDEMCKQIHDAMKGWGASHDQLIQIMGGTLCDDRHKISLRYKELYNEVLFDRVNKECSGDYGTAMEFLACSPAVAECYMLKKAFKGAGCIEEVVYSILCGRSNEEIDFLKKTYYKTFTGDLSKLVGNEIGGDFSKIASACLQVCRFCLSSFWYPVNYCSHPPVSCFQYFRERKNHLTVTITLLRKLRRMRRHCGKPVKGDGSVLTKRP